MRRLLRYYFSLIDDEARMMPHDGGDIDAAAAAYAFLSPLPPPY